MSGQNAKRSDDFVSTEARLESLLDRLNSLGGAAAPVDTAAPVHTAAPVDTAPARMLRSVPDLDDAPAAMIEADPPVTPEAPINVVLPEAPDMDFLADPPLETIIEPVEEARLQTAPVEVAPVEIAPVEIAPAEALEAPRFMLPPLPSPLSDTPAEPISFSKIAEEAIEEEAFEAEAIEDADTPADEWVSYHDESRDPFDPIEAIDMIESSASVETAAPTYEAAEWTTEPAPAQEPLQEVPGPFDTLSVSEDPAASSSDVHPLDIEETLDFSEFDDMESVVGLEELANDLDLLSAVPQAPSPDFGEHGELGSLYESDDDLPLPDFTGVWVETGEGTVWDKDTAAGENLIPDPIEQAGKGSGIAVGRTELDSLRPVEEAVLEEEPANIARKLQLVMVVLVGLMALAIMYLDDPATIDDLRSVYDGFFG